MTSPELQARLRAVHTSALMPDPLRRDVPQEGRTLLQVEIERLRPAMTRLPV